MVMVLFLLIVKILISFSKKGKEGQNHVEKIRKRKKKIQKETCVN